MIFDAIVTGFESGVEVRNALPAVELKSSIFFGNVTQSDGFFDATAAYIGAFRSDDTWATGAWVSYALN